MMVLTPQGRTTICNFVGVCFLFYAFLCLETLGIPKMHLFFALVVLQIRVWEANRLQKKKVAKLRAIKDLQPSAKIVQPFSLQMSLLR
jgi:hypothetical protein